MSDVYNEVIESNDICNINANDNVNDISIQEYADIDKKKYRMLRNAYIKLDSLPLSFGLPSYDDTISNDTIEKYFRVDLADTLRETGLNIEDIDDNSKDEMYFENRIVYHALKRFRLTASVFFKFSTAVDGKTIDKTQIPKMLSSILKEYDDEYKSWRLGSIGKLWNRVVS